MFRAFHEKRKSEEGFTLIELLVVILIIAILAAIAIPIFLNQRKKGWQSQMESALKNAATSAESYAVENDGSYTGMTVSALRTEGYRDTASVTTDAPTLDALGNNYCIAVSHSKLGTAKKMFISTAVTVPTKGTCGAGGVGTASTWSL